MFPAKISNLFSTPTSRTVDATISACDENSCTNLDCIVHGLRHPLAVVKPSPRQPTTNELPHATEPTAGTDNAWTNIALASPPPAITFSSFDGAGDNTMTGALDASNLEKGYQAGMVHTAPNTVIGMPTSTVNNRSRRWNNRHAIPLLIAVILLAIGMTIWRVLVWKAYVRQHS